MYECQGAMGGMQKKFPWLGRGVGTEEVTLRLTWQFIDMCRGKGPPGGRNSICTWGSLLCQSNPRWVGGPIRGLGQSYGEH